MKRYLILLLIVPLVIVGCAKKKPIIEYDEDIHDKILKEVGKTNDKQVVFKKVEKNETQYYVYEINNINFNLYNYTFFNLKKDYEEAVSKYEENPRFELSSDDKALVTKIFIQKGSKSNEEKDLKEAIIDKYKDDKDYELVE